VSGIVLQISSLRKSFGQNQVLRGVDLAVGRGEVFALLGSNGAGKTTTVNICATLVKPDGGTVTVGGFDIRRQPAQVRQRISLTGQFAAIDGLLTGYENLALMAKLRRVAQPQRIASELLERFGLAEVATRRAATYSGGLARRLDLAMSLVGAPSLIFLDEPTTGLDPQARREAWRVIASLAADGTAILLTTQYLEEAEHLAHRIGILHGGHLIAEGSPAELRRLYPPAQPEYVLKQPSLEDIFLTVIGAEGEPE
jgi:ABC-2 type transport system ATP-binding protein